MNSPKRLKSKQATINPKKNDDKCFQYASTVALSHEQVKFHPDRISKIKLFIDQYNWKEIYFQVHKKDWNQFEKNSKTIALNMLYVPYNSEEIRHSYKSKHNLTRKNQIILLMITVGKKLHYLAVKILSTFSRGITSKHNKDVYY